MADKYVDYSATNDGDGTTAAQAGSPGGVGAYNTLASKTFSAGDNIWVRRVASGTIGSGTTLSQTVGCNIIGWPKSTDTLYSTRPASGTSNGWDSDSADYATLTYNSSSNSLTISGQNYVFYRIAVQQNASSALTSTISGTSNTFYDCKFKHNHATQGNVLIHNVSGTGNTFVRTIWQSAQSSTTTFPMQIQTGTKNRFFDCTITIDSLTTKGYLSIPGNDNFSQNLTISLGATSSGSPVITMGGNNNRFFDTHFSSSGSNNSYKPITLSGNYNSFLNAKADQGGGGTDGMALISGTGNYLSFHDFDQITQGTSGINITGNANRIVLKNGTFNASGQDINFNTTNYDNEVICNNVTFSTTPIVATGYARSNKFFSANHNRTTGAFKQVVKSGTVDVSSVTRTGGETFSLLLQNTIADVGDQADLQVGIPGYETIWLALSAGSTTITIYGAHKGYGATPPLTHNVWMELEYLDSGGDYTHVTTYAYGAGLTSDTSTWTGDTSLTKFKLTTTVTVNADCVIPIRLYYGCFVASAICYIDPKPVVS